MKYGAIRKIGRSLLKDSNGKNNATTAELHACWGPIHGTAYKHLNRIHNEVQDYTEITPMRFPNGNKSPKFKQQIILL